MRRVLPPAAADPAGEEWMRLGRILALEAQKGYPDRTVIGGLAGYLDKLVDRLAAGGAVPDAQAQARRLRTLLAAYAAQEPAERARAIAAAQALLEQAAPGNGAASAPRAEVPSAAPSAARPAPPAVAASPPRPSPPPAAPAPRRPRPVDAALPGVDRALVEVPGVGANRMRLLGRLGLQTVGDLLGYFPSRHLDYPPPARAVDLFFQQRASFEGAVRRVEVHPTSRGLQRTSVVLGDATGEVEAVWFRAGYGLRLAPGQRIAVSGDLMLNGRRPVFENPDWEPADQGPLHTRCLVPVYPTTKGLPQTWLRELVARAVERWADTEPEPLPDWLRAEERLLPRPIALRAMHYPRDAAEAEDARRRFAFDELLVLQVVVLQRRREAEHVQGRPLPTPRALLDAFAGALPFALTEAQQRVIGEVCTDLAQPRPMTRLLQGEVGSGKTVVAAAAMLVALAAGAQAVLMAPTEILAEQHYRTVSALYERAAPALTAALGRPPVVALLTGRLPARTRRALREQIAAGAIDVVVGTQAVIQSGVDFRDLAFAVADEQHRFGVRQRLALRDKGQHPHLLVMTATPIPRTLALTLYGDLDLSRLDGLPPGRKPIRTVLLRPSERRHAYERMRREVAAGRQGYVICPLVEDSPHLEVRAATEEYARLQASELAGLRLGLVHGRLRGEEKEAAMARFRDGEIDVLVATAVVEVGVDVPNATLMLIEGAERFGLAQLHQFRGRVGRGEHAATCALITEAASQEALERLQVVVDCADGLALAEADLRLRGPGDFYGLRQSGLPDLQVASLGDVALIERARRAAERVLAADPPLRAPEHAALADLVRARAARVGEPN
ncbi:MAG TPA: ATP-dependent DNA helicase RecG [Chloroflexota bacterium]